MTSYESESSENDSVSLITTNVVLGYASKEPTDDGISQLGGQPVWIEPLLPLPLAWTTCRVCKNHLSLLLQLHGNLPEHFPHHERRLFIFGCRRNECKRENGFIRAFRSVRSFTDSTSRTTKAPLTLHDSISAAQGRNDLGDAIFGVMPSTQVTHQSNPFVIATEASLGILPTSIDPVKSVQVTEGEPKSTSYRVEPRGLSVNDGPPVDSLRFEIARQFARSKGTLKLESKAAVQNELSLSKPFPKYHLEADYEILDDATTTPPSISFMNIESSLPVSSQYESVAFESAHDKVFQRFADRLAQNPLQVLRYEFGGIPLLYSKKDEVGGRLSSPIALHQRKTPNNSSATVRFSLNIPTCGNCGSNRVFEVQLTPHAISLLEVDDMGVEGMEWGTIIVGVCENDCIEAESNIGQIGYIEEWVGIQWEEKLPPH